MDIEADKGEALVFAGAMMQQVNTEDVANMVQVQRGMLQRFEKTNEMLINFNQLSSTRYEASVKDFQQHTQLLYDMKKDLDSIFKRIRVLKQRLSKSYPEAFAACSSIIMMEEEEEDASTTTTAAATGSTTTTTSTSQPAPRAQPASRPSGPASLGVVNKSSDDGGEEGKARGCHSHKPRSKSAAGRKEGGSSPQPVQRKTSRSATESHGSRGAVSGSVPSQAKLI
ncbi:uncharacterized protein LOC143296938 isoform X2 [Babylonia areolata]|uniref:uncharacterized protein LOC143296938 isoform X2 n=1 Tax=Babylonia areolata TaxID=304850 RepID=UPI003FD20EB1